MSWYPPDHEEPKVPFDWDEHETDYVRYRATVKKWQEAERRAEQLEQLARLRTHVLELEHLLSEPRPHLVEWWERFDEEMTAITEMEIQI